MCGGARHALGGNFFQPTVLADVTTEMKVAREETFGPVAPLFRFETEAEAIALANDTEFGLAAYFLLAGNGGAQPAPYADVITDEGTAQGLSGTEVTVSGIAHEGGVQIGGTLYSDALSQPDGPAPTYLRLIEHNARSLATALQA